MCCMLTCSPLDMTFDAERRMVVMSGRGTGRADIAVGALEGIGQKEY